MRTRNRIIVIGATVCFLALGTALVLAQPGQPGAASSTNTPASGTSSATMQPQPGATSPSSAPTAIPSDQPNDQAPAPSHRADQPLEVMPPSSSTETQLPPSAITPALLNAPAPSTSSANGALAAGYPSESLPPEPNSTITSSAVATDGEHVQLSLVAVSSTDVDGVLSFYTTALARYGYFSATPFAPGLTQQSYSGPGGTVSLSAEHTPGGTSYSLFASVVVAR